MENFKTLAEKYKIIFFDAYGVIKNYKGLIPGIKKTFEWLQQQSKGYYVITNDASRSPELLADAFFKAGLKAITPDRIISSGMLAKEFLDLKVKKGLVAYLGTEDSAHYIEHPGLDTLPLQQMNENNIHDITALVLLDDEGFDWNDGLNKAVNLLRQRPIPAIIANPDGAYPMSKREVSIAIGGLAYMVEKITGKKFIRFGKPDSQIFIFAWDYIFQHYLVLTKKEFWWFGDPFLKNILGGNSLEWITALVLTANCLLEDYN